MPTVAFASGLGLATNHFSTNKLSAQRHSRPSTQPPLRMSAAADRFMSRSKTREAKAAATNTGVYTVQCTEGTGGANNAERTRIAWLARNFRLRQSSPLERYADLFATRRAAVARAGGSHVAESYAVRFPARAAASVTGRAEALRACSRYVRADSKADQFMFRASENGDAQICSEARTGGDEEMGYVVAAATEFRAGLFSKKEIAQQRYDVRLEAVFWGEKGAYEEGNYLRFPKMAGALKCSTGAYVASVLDVSTALGTKVKSVTEQIEGVNRDSFWPSFERRTAVERKKKAWETSAVKQYATMSVAATEFGIKAQSSKFEENVYQRWKSGWKPVSRFQLQTSK